MSDMNVELNDIKVIIFKGQSILMDKNDKLPFKQCNENLIDDIVVSLVDDIDKKEYTQTMVKNENDADILIVVDKSKKAATSGYKWIDLLETDSFDDDTKTYFKKIYRECNKNNIRGKFLSPLYNIYLSSEKQRERYLVKHNDFADDYKTSIVYRYIAVFGSLFAGWMFDRFFLTGRLPGISMALFAVFMIGLIVFMAKNRDGIKNPITIITMLTIIVLSLNFAAYNNEILYVLNVLSLPVLIIILMLKMSWSEKFYNTVSIAIGVLKRGLIYSFSIIGRPFKFLFHPVAGKEIENESLKVAVKGIFISLPIALIVMLLISSADNVIAWQISKIKLDELFWHTIAAVTVGIYIFCLIWSVRYKHTLFQKDYKISSWHPATIITILAVMNIIYIAFTVIQVKYLYMGITLPNNMTYAEYARQGFGQLISVAVINIIITILFTGFLDTTVKGSGWAKLMIGITTILTCNMLYSAFLRMSLYQDAYGFTRMRIMVDLFLAMIGVILFVLLIKVFLKNIKLGSWILAVLLISLMAVNIVNIDNITMNMNLDRYEKIGKIDEEYLSYLSIDAEPLLKARLGEANYYYKETQYKWLKYYNEDRKDIIENKEYRWYEWNLYRWRFYNLN